MKKVELIHTEVVPKYGTNEVISEFKNDKGTVLKWQVKTRVNDKAEKSPVVFDQCTVFADNQEKIDNIRNTVVNGAILNITGYEDRYKGSKPDKNGKTVYYSQVNVKEIINVSGNPTEDLPF